MEVIHITSDLGSGKLGALNKDDDDDDDIGLKCTKLQYFKKSTVVLHCNYKNLK